MEKLKMDYEKNYNKELFKKLAEKFTDKFIFINWAKSQITISIQNGPIGEYGHNGTQIDDLGKIWLEILKEFNAKYPCRENSLSITKIQEALFWQDERTKDRKKRQVEGTNQK
jgi:hypothetical protein